MKIEGSGRGVFLVVAFEAVSPFLPQRIAVGGLGS